MLQLTDIAEQIREARKARKLSQAALAERAGISRAQIERLSYASSLQPWSPDP